MRITCRCCLAPFQWHPRSFSAITLRVRLTRNDLYFLWASPYLVETKEGKNTSLWLRGNILLSTMQWRMVRSKDYVYCAPIGWFLAEKERLWVARLAFFLESGDMWEKQQKKRQERIREKYHCRLLITTIVRIKKKKTTTVDVR